MKRSMLSGSCVPSIKGFRAIFLAMGLFVPSALPLAAAAVEAPSGETAFDSPPQLVNSRCSYSSVRTPSTYYFTLKLPANSGEALSVVRITQMTKMETVKVIDGSIYAFEGDRSAKGAALPLASIGGDSAPGEVMVMFDPPVQPGNTVTVAFKTLNPSSGGEYRFGVTAFPEGESSRGQFLGSGCVHIYED